MVGNRERLEERNRQARLRLAEEHRRLETEGRLLRLSGRDRWMMRAIRLERMPDDGSCCGAPRVPVASARFVRRHRRGVSRGERLPCRRALLCEAEWARFRRRYPECFTPENKKLRQQRRVLDAISRQTLPGDAPCCGAPRVATASTKFVWRHRHGYSHGGRKPCEWALRCQAKYLRQWRQGLDGDRLERVREQRKAQNRRRRTGRPTGRPPEPVVHGTVSGYLKERRRDGVEICDACRTAWRNHQRAYKASRKETAML